MNLQPKLPSFLGLFNSFLLWTFNILVFIPATRNIIGLKQVLQFLLIIFRTTTLVKWILIVINGLHVCEAVLALVLCIKNKIRFTQAVYWTIWTFIFGVFSLQLLFQGIDEKIQKAEEKDK